MTYLCWLVLGVTAASAQPYAYTANAAQNTVSVVNMSSSSVIASIPVPGGPAGIAVTPDGSTIYAALATTNTVVAISAASRSVVATIPVGVSPKQVAIHPNGASIYVVDQGSSQVTVISHASKTVATTIGVGSYPSSITLSSDGARAFVANSVSSSISVIDTSSNLVISSFATSPAPDVVAAAPNGQTLYVASQSSGVVTAYNTSGSLISTIHGLIYPTSLTVTPNGGRMYVTNGNAASVSVIDTTSNSVIATVPVGLIPTFAAISTDVTQLYVINEFGFSLSVIDMNSNTLAGTVSGVGVYPIAVATQPPPRAVPPTCSFTVSPGNLSFSAGGGSSSIGISASGPSCSWTASAPSWISLTPGNGTGSGSIQVQANANTSLQALSGTITVAGQSFPVSQAAGSSPPVAVSVSPGSGSGLGPQTFSALYSDPAGALDLQVVYLDFAPTPGAGQSCFLAYVQASNGLYLLSDTNGSALGPITPGSGGVVQNSQCTLSGNGGSATRAGNNLTVPFSVTFAPGFAGSKNIYGLAQNYSGANGGWQTLGTWTIASAGLSAVSVTPSSGSGVTQTFSAVYSDPSGVLDLQVVYLNLATSPGALHSCFIAYVQASNALYLLTDTNGSALGPVTPGTSGAIQNSQCRLSGSGGSASGAGNTLTVSFSVTFLSGFSGAKSIYGLAQSYSGANGGWQMLGAWTALSPSLAALSVSPVNGNGFSQTFAATYTDPSGASDLQVVYLDFGNSIFGANSCIVAFAPGGNTLYLFNDASTGATSMTVGGAGTLSNSQCTLSASGGTASLSGNNLTIPFAITFAAGFAGVRNVYGLAQSYSGAQGAWQTLGTWNP